MEELKIVQLLITNNRPGTAITPGSLTVHNTADPGATARQERDYLQNHPAARVSFHFAVDDREAVQCLPLGEMSWHAGSTANRESISIEVCEFDEPARQEAANQNAAWLVARLLRQFGWNLRQIKTHRDWTGKNCPRKLLPNWDQFLQLVQTRLSQGSGDASRFRDLPMGHWAWAEIEAAAAAGWVAGFSDGTFRPGQPLTRAEAVVLISRALNCRWPQGR